jgi:hypothetical protein
MTDRETWLLTAYAAVSKIFAREGHELPGIEQIKISTGFGLARGENKHILGQTIAPGGSADGKTWTIFVSPVLATGEDALNVLCHEALHALVGCDAGHGPEFARAGKALGLEGKPTSMLPGPALQAELMLLAMELGDYPHVAVDMAKVLASEPEPTPAGGGRTGARTRITTGPARQSCRHIRCQCTNDVCEARGYLVRTTARWLEYGAPLCPACGAPMEVE